MDIGVELVRCVPERAEWSGAGLVIPHARGHEAISTGHAAHFGKSRNGVGHEMHHELGQRDVEHSTFEWELLSGGTTNIDRGVTLLSRGHEGFGRIDGRHGGRSQPPHQLGR